MQNKTEMTHEQKRTAGVLHMKKSSKISSTVNRKLLFICMLAIDIN